MTAFSVRRSQFVFDWETAAGRGLALAGFVVLSFLLHAFAFYVFQIVYPPAISLLPPPARVSLITSDSEEGRTILRWLDAEDPAVASSTIRPVEMKPVALPTVEHVPSYVAHEPALKNAPPLEEDLRMPPSQPPGPVILPYRKPEQGPLHLPTAVTFSSEIQKLGAAVLPNRQFVASTHDAPQAIAFRIAVGSQGDVRYCFAENSSGDRDLDEQARTYLANARFPGSGTKDLIWGSAIVEWGNDVVRPRPAGTATSQP